MSGRFNYRLFLYGIGIMLLFFAAAFVVPAVVGFAYLESSSWVFVFCSVICFLLGTILKTANADYNPFLSKRDGRLIIGLVWIILPLIGALPYTFLSSRFGILDAIFESFSGFTTTGSSLVADFNSIPHSMLLWRAMTQWIGCLGFILVLISLMPSLRNDAHNFFNAEFNSINKDKVRPHLKATIYIIFIIYSLLSLICFVGLLIADMDVFNALCYTLATVSTGGFMFNNGGLSVFSPYVKPVLMVIMFLSGISYYLLYFLITSKRKHIFKDEQAWIYVKLIFFASLILSFFFYFRAGFPLNFHEILAVLEKGFFYVVSAVSTTGYSLSNVGLPLFAAVFLVFLMFPGGCSSSSTTGLKVVRITVLFRYAVAAIKRLLYPRSIIPVKFNSVAIRDESINTIFGFFFLYIMICILGASLLTLCGISFDDAVMVSAANINNVGSLGEELSSNLFSYLQINPAAKIILITLMIIGRLEIYSFFALFSRSIWSRR
ncbi:MAG: TrkH family potassium uptake protein [Bacteroidales bacterium]|jgi:trk system potassium uptake protein TrkH|nr:TrkH family potassium uptake protein [Bacteroidales bacterium]